MLQRRCCWGWKSGWGFLISEVAQGGKMSEGDGDDEDGDEGDYLVVPGTPCQEIRERNRANTGDRSGHGLWFLDDGSRSRMISHSQSLFRSRLKSRSRSCQSISQSLSISPGISIPAISLLIALCDWFIWSRSLRFVIDQRNMSIHILLIFL